MRLIQTTRTIRMILIDNSMMSSYEEMFDLTENMCLAMDHSGNDEEEGNRKNKKNLSTCSLSYSCNIMTRVTSSSLHLRSTTNRVDTF
jgi:hypothetical protein